jgi:hypothetical protein
VGLEREDLYPTYQMHSETPHSHMRYEDFSVVVRADGAAPDHPLNNYL